MIPFIDGDICEAKFKDRSVYVKLTTLYALYPNELFLTSNEYVIEGIKVVYKFLSYPMVMGSDEFQNIKYRPDIRIDYVYSLETFNEIDAKDLCDKLNIKIFALKRSNVINKIHGQLIISPMLRAVFKRIQNFFASKDTYKKYGIKHRRGVLLYGPPGTGKSTFIHYVVSNYPQANLFENFYDFSESLEDSSYKKDTPNIIYIDEVESRVGSTRERKQMLEDLEGVEDNTLVIATTNLPELLGPEFYNRPGRFEEAVYVGYPTLKEIAAFLKARDCTDLIEYAIGLNFAHLNELIYRVKINNEDPEKASREIKKIGDKPLSGSNKNAKGGLGFGSDTKTESESDNEDLDDDDEMESDLLGLMEPFFKRK